VIFTAFTLSGPVLGAIGLYFELATVFWVGLGLALLNLFMNLASGAMKLPILPSIFAIAAAAILSPWYFGASIGLLAYTAFEGLSELVSPGKRRNG
jgi:hypothetical protein